MENNVTSGCSCGAASTAPGKFASMTLADFSEALASAQPTPGGGAAAGYAGSLAAAAGCMAAAFSAAKPEAPAELKAALDELELIRKYLLQQTDEDAKGFAPLQRYMAMPKDDPRRNDHLQASLRVACTVPTEVMYTSGRVVELLAVVAEKGSTALVSDAGVGIELAMAALRCARLNILTNARLIQDDVIRMTMRRECEIALANFTATAEKALRIVEERLA